MNNILNEISYGIIGCAFKVHTQLGPGLLESSYEACLYDELNKLGCFVERQKELPIIYDDINIETGYRIDLLVNNMVLIELKSVAAILPIHKAQVLTYLKLSKVKLGLLINFNVVDLKEGIQRIIL